MSQKTAVLAMEAAAAAAAMNASQVPPVCATVYFGDRLQLSRF